VVAEVFFFSGVEKKPLTVVVEKDLNLTRDPQSFPTKIRGGKGGILVHEGKRLDSIRAGTSTSKRKKGGRK